MGKLFVYFLLGFIIAGLFCLIINVVFGVFNGIIWLGASFVSFIISYKTIYKNGTD